MSTALTRVNALFFSGERWGDLLNQMVALHTFIQLIICAYVAHALCPFAFVGFLHLPEKIRMERFDLYRGIRGHLYQVFAGRFGRLDPCIDRPPEISGLFFTR